MASSSLSHLRGPWPPVSSPSLPAAAVDPAVSLPYEFEWIESTPDILAEEARLLPEAKQGRTLASPKVFPPHKSEEHRPFPSTPPRQKLPKQLNFGDTPNARWSPATSGSVTSSKTTLNELIRADANKRHASEFYQMVPDRCRDDLIMEVMSTPAFQEDLKLLRSKIKGYALEKDVEVAISTLGNTFHTILAQKRGRSPAQRAKLIAQGHRNIRNTTPEDKEINRLDVVVLEDSSLYERHSSTSSAQYSWEDVASFIEVKRSAVEDGSDVLITQCLEYTRKIFQYRLITSHLHFVTCCGPFIRLWYVDAELFGCSRVVSIAHEDGLLDLGRILCLLTDKEAQTALYGRWDPFTYPPVSYLPFTPSRGSMCDTPAPLDWMDSAPLRLAAPARPGPFGSRTVVMEGRQMDETMDAPLNSSRRTFIKCVWLPKHLVDHELTIQHGLQELTSTPNPRGRVTTPSIAASTGFKSSTATTPGREAKGEMRLCFSSFAYEHRLGRMITSQVPEIALFSLHRQMTEQLRDYAMRGYHYRDLNAGNMLIEDGTEDTLVLVDHGNGRQHLGPRGRYKEVQSALSTAQDDARSTNTYFLPSCAGDADYAVQSWHATLDEFEWKTRRKLEGERADASLEVPNSSEELACPAFNAAGSLRHHVLRHGRDTLRKLKTDLKKILSQSHRYIDDLESLQYLHLWQACERSASISTLDMNLRKMDWKRQTWGATTVFGTRVRELCVQTMSPQWCDLMVNLHTEIVSAQEQVRARLERVLDEELDLDRVEQAFHERLQHADLDTADGPTICKELLASAFDGFACLGKVRESLQPEEEKGFEACISLLQTATSQARVRMQRASSTLLS